MNCRIVVSTLVLLALMPLAAQACEQGDFVWDDLNCNGIQDLGEPGIPNVTVKLTDCAGRSVTDLFGHLVGPTTTDAKGKYYFSNVNPGEYVVTFTLPPGYAFTAPFASGNPETNSNADPVTGESDCHMLPAGQIDYSVDAGMCKTVQPPPVTADCVTINAVQGTPITPVTMVGSGGCGGPYTFSATGLPAGLTMASDGTISGTPTVSGTFPYTVTVTDACSNTGAVNCSVTVQPPGAACTITGVTISNTSWNAFKIPAGTSPVVWVHAHIGKPSGVPTTGVSTVQFTGVTLTLNGTTYALPDGVLTFDPSAPTVTSTIFSGGKWQTLINPSSLSDEIFFTGAAIPVTPAIAAEAKATLSYTVLSSAKTLSFSWQWSAAVFTYWPADWNSAMILPYHQSLHAGTPLNTTVQKSLIQGPRGGGGSNFTGSWSATGTAKCP